MLLNTPLMVLNMLFYGLVGVQIIYILFRICRAVYRVWKVEREPVCLYHKPTGVVIEMPAKYEAQAIDQLLADLKKVGGVPLNSPEFQVIRTAGR